MEIPTGAAHCQIAVFYPADCCQFCRKFFYPGGVTTHNDNFQAVVMVHMYVGGRNDLMMKIMLQFGDSLLKLILVMVINQGNDTHHLLVRIPLLPDKRLANKIPYCFGAIIVLPVLYISIELGK